MAKRWRMGKGSWDLENAETGERWQNRKSRETAEEKPYRENFEDTERATVALWGRGPAAWSRGLGKLGWRGCQGGAVEVGKGDMVGEVRAGEGNLTVSCPDEPGLFPPAHPTPPRCGVQWLLFSEVIPVHYAPCALPASGLLRMRTRLPCPLTFLRLSGMWLRGTCQEFLPGVPKACRGPAHLSLISGNLPFSPQGA